MNPSDFIESANRYAATGQPYLFIADFELQKPLLYPATDIPEGIFFSFPGHPNHNFPEMPPQDFDFERQPIDFALYSQSCRHVINYINRIILYPATIRLEYLTFDVQIRIFNAMIPWEESLQPVIMK